MTIAAALANSIITDSGRDIAAKVALMVGQGLPIGDALAIAAEIGLTQGRAEGVDIVHARLRTIKYGELPR